MVYINTSNNTMNMRTIVSIPICYLSYYKSGSVIDYGATGLSVEVSCIKYRII
jgi:hypothetical protein